MDRAEQQTFTLAQISDTHIRSSGQASKIPADPVSALEAAVDRINQGDPAIDAVVVTGDLVDLGTAQEYATLRSALDRLAVRYFVVPGNHDDRDTLREAFSDHDYLPPDGPIAYVIEDFPIRLVALDTWRAQRPDGEVGPAQLEWLDAVLAEAPDRQTIIFMHHPPITIGIALMDQLNCRDGTALEGVVARHPQVERVIAGHVHRPVVRRWGGTVLTTSPSPWAQLALTLGAGQPPGYSDEPASLPLHFWSSATGLVTHLMPVRNHSFVPV